MSIAKRYKIKAKKSYIFLIIIAILIGLLVYSGYHIVEWKINGDKNKEIIKETSEYITVNIEENNNIQEEKISVDFESLKIMNPDVVAWIKVNNTDIEFPVVKGKDNEYYLTHNLKKDYNKAGWIFMDYRNNLDGNDFNTIIYGHNMKNNLMFGTLKNVLDKQWYENEKNRYITFITEIANEKYEIFSIYEIEEEEYSIKTAFKNEQDYLKFLNALKGRSIKDFYVELSKDDRILTLSTCTNDRNHRLVVHAKLIR